MHMQPPRTAPLTFGAQHVSHQHRDVIQVANCFCWQNENHINAVEAGTLRRLRKSSSALFGSVAERQMTPHDVIINTPVSVCVRVVCARMWLTAPSCWLGNTRSRLPLSLLPMLSLCRSKKTLYKVPKGPRGNDHNEKVHIMFRTYSLIIGLEQLLWPAETVKDPTAKWIK